MPSSSSPRSSVHATVIVVDDVEAMRELVVAYLRRIDPELTLVAASNALQALAMVESYASLGPDPREQVIVISDLRMPGVDGLSFLGMLARSPHRVTTILMTAFADDDVEKRASDAGALACFAKPFDLDELAAVVERRLRDVEAELAHPN